MSEWQPIETADKSPHRKAILAWFPDIQCSFTIIWSRPDQRWIHFGGYGRTVEQPSHWMPLPDPPTTEKS